MTECSSCGAELTAHETHCPICGKPTVYYHRQRRCLHCGTPAAEQAKTCLMCAKPIDSLPLRSSIFSGSWLGIGLGVLIIVGIVLGLDTYQKRSNQAALAAQRPSATPTSTPTITPPPGPTHTPTMTATFTPTATPTPRTHIVQGGENPSYIAALYGVTVDELIAANNIDDVRSLRVGQELVVPYAAEGEDSGGGDDNLPPLVVYVIKEGDTLLDIALRYGTSIEAISSLNPNSNLDLIYPGQELVVPIATPTATSTPTATLTPTATSGPPYQSPDLLSPTAGQVVDDETLLFNWTATGLLAEDEFYVVQLVWPDGSYTEHWTKSNAWRITKAQRPAPGPVSWSVAIMHQTGAAADNAPQGVPVVEPGERRVVEWP